ncbi:MAG: rhodanese-like domain-containing protein [Planctomycetota bacterium]
MPLKKNLADLAAQVRERGEVVELDPEELQDELSEPDGLVLIDVREPDERARGHLPGSLAIPAGVLERDIEKKAFTGGAGHLSDADLGRPIVLYCGGGHRSLLAGDRLLQMGFTDVRSLAGGFKAWAESGGAVV